MYPRLLLVIFMTVLVVTVGAAFISDVSFPFPPVQSNQNPGTTEATTPTPREESSISSLPAPVSSTEAMTGGIAEVVKSVEAVDRASSHELLESISGQSAPSQPNDKELAAEHSAAVTDLSGSFRDTARSASSPAADKNYCDTVDARTSPGHEPELDTRRQKVPRARIRAISSLGENKASGKLKNRTPEAKHRYAMFDIYVAGGPHIIIRCGNQLDSHKLPKGCR